MENLFRKFQLATAIVTLASPFATGCCSGEDAARAVLEVVVDYEGFEVEMPFGYKVSELEAFECVSKIDDSDPDKARGRFSSCMSKVAGTSVDCEIDDGHVVCERD